MTNASRAVAVVERLMREGLIEKYAIGGAVAALFYVEPTNTEDIDIFVHLEPSPGSAIVVLDPLLNRLRELGYATWHDNNIVVEDWPIQFLPVATPLQAEALAAAMRHPMEEIEPFVLSAEYVMALALDLSRPKDKIRLEQFIRHAGQAYDPAAFQMILDRHGLAAKWQRLLALWGEGPSMLS